MSNSTLFPFLLLILWILFMVPGKLHESFSESYSTSVEGRVYGWPFVQLTSISVELHGYRNDDGQMVWPRNNEVIPHGKYLAKLDELDAERKMYGKTRILNLTPMFSRYERITDFWFNPKNWPLHRIDTKYEWSFLGLVANTIFLACVGMFVNRRTREGTN